LLKTGDISGYIRGYSYKSSIFLTVMSKIQDRIKQYIDNKDISKREFCRKINASASFLAKDSEISSDKLLNIINAYQDISIEWLVTGNGKMLKETGTLMPEDQQHLFDICEELKKKCEKLRKEIEEKDAVIKNLVKTNLLLAEAKNGGVVHRGNDAECADVG
jgi:hypothetical protein